MIQSGDDDWIINFIPARRQAGFSGNESGALVHKVVLIGRIESFLLDGHLPVKQKIFSLCPLCPCGEESISDKTDRR